MIAAGERWHDDDSLRPALEDQLGAAAVLSGLVARGHRRLLSPEALATAQLFEAGRSRIAAWLHECVGGRELASKGFGADVDVAAALDVSTVVPVLVDDAFAAAKAGHGARGLLAMNHTGVRAEEWLRGPFPGPTCP